MVELPIDNSWSRDSAPISSATATARGSPPTKGLNAWGEKHKPFEHDATMGKALCEYLGIQRDFSEAPLVLEGGSVATDGEGTFVTTERCLPGPPTATPR